MWREMFKEPNLPLNQGTVICVDLPGYGGSDSFEVYDTAVLEALTEFIIGMGEKYVPEDDSQLNGTAESNARSTPRDLIVIGHDWGCVLGMRLAAEAPDIAYKFLLSNGPHVSLSQLQSWRTVQY
jgi:pimeloyl-ACP methyl ester carboxylesterase